MLRSEKVQVVKDLKEKFKTAEIFVLTDFRGLTVEEMNTLRRDLREKNVEFRVVKNLLAKRALDENDQGELDDLLVGPTAVAFGYEDPVESVKVLVNFQKEQEKLQLKGGMMEGNVLDVAMLKELAQMPTLDELYARMLGSVQSPINKMVMALNNAASELVWVIKSVADQKSG